LSYTMFRTTPYLIRSQLELLNTSLSGKIYWNVIYPILLSVLKTGPLLLEVILGVM
jgi:hypothetical protein